MSRHTYADIDPEIVQDYLDYLLECYSASWYHLAVALCSSAGRLLAIRCGDKRITAALWKRVDALHKLNADDDPGGFVW